jgi:peptide/histidine transporter 3/4
MLLLLLQGLAMLTVAGSLKTFRPPQCPGENLSCQAASLSQLAYLYGSLYVVDLGAGGLQGTVIPFGADQFDEEDEKEKAQKSSFFNWAYQTILTGSFISSTLFVYLQERVSFGLGWGIACVVQLVGTITLVMGLKSYRYHNPGGNPFVRIAQVSSAAFKKRKMKVLSIDDLFEVQDAQSAIQGSRRILHSNQFR